MSKKILITGGAGFVGSNLCKYLLNQGNKIICLDNLSFGRLENIKEFEKNPSFEFIKHDINKPIKLKNLDEIYNLACPASPIAHRQEPIFTWKTSTFGIFNMLELARSNGNIPFLHTSTSEVYGNSLEHPQKETYRGNVNPSGVRACYKESKRAGESIIFDYHRTYKLPVRVIRVFNTYGPNMAPNDGRVISTFITQALQNQNITIHGSGSQTRSFQYIDDLILGIDKMMHNKTDFTGPINIGNPNEFTIKKLANLILKMIPYSKSKIIYVEKAQDDANKRQPNISLAQKKLKWKPKIPLEEGLVKTIKYLQTQI